MLHASKCLKNSVTDEGELILGSCTLPFARGEESKYYCSLELCFVVMANEELVLLQSPRPINEQSLFQLTKSIEHRAMNKIHEPTTPPQ